jgi:hypothetical protein
MTEGHRQIKGSRTMWVDGHRARITGDTMDRGRRTKGSRTITHRRIERATAIVTGNATATATKAETSIVIAITIMTGMANHIITFTPHREPRLRCRQVNRFWCV